MAVAGTLEIQLLANMARLQADMTQAKGVVGGAMSSISSAVATAKTALGALGIGLSIGAVVAYAKHILDTAESINKMSQKIGISVPELSKLRYAADQSDVSMDALGKGIKKLSQEMIAGGDATSKSGKLMKLLGVDLKAGVNPALEQIADTFKALPDGTTKAALAVELFGKAGMDMIPFLNQGSEGIRKMKDEAVRLGLVMTADMTQAAERFNDSLKTLKFQSDAMAASFIGDLLPGLNRITAAMIEAKRDSGTLYAIWVLMGGAASEALSLNDTDAEISRKALRDLQKEALSLSEKLAQVNGVPFDKLPISLRVVFSRLEEVNLALRVMNALADSAAGKFDDQRSRQMRQGQVLPRNKAVDEEEIKRALGVADAKAASELKLYTGELQKLEMALQKVNHQTEVEKLTYEMAKGSLMTLTAAHKAHLLVVAKELDLKNSIIAANKSWIEGAQIIIDKQKAMDDVLANFNTTTSEYLQNFEFETSLLKKSSEAIDGSIEGRKKLAIEQETATALRKLYNDYVKASTGLEQLEFDTLTAIYELQKLALPAAIAARAEINASMEAQKLSARGWEDFADRVIHGFGDMRAALKAFWQDLLAMMAKKWILQIVAAITGNGALSVAAGQVGQGTMGGSLMSAGASYLGQTALGSSVTGAYGSFVAGYQGATLGPAAGGMGPTTAGSTGFMGAGSSTAGMMGTVLWVAAVVAAMYANNEMYTAGWRRPEGSSTRNPLTAVQQGGPLMGASYSADAVFRSLGFSPRMASLFSGSSMNTRLFGHGPLNQDAFGVGGSFVGTDVSATNWQDWSRRGGVFRSDQRGTDVTGLDAGQQDFFTDFMAGLESITTDLGNLLDVDRLSALAGYSRDFNLQYSENGQVDPERVRKLYGDLFGSVLQEQVALILRAGGHTSLADTVQALKGTGEEIGSTIEAIVGMLGLLDERLSVEELIAAASKTSSELFRDQGDALLELAGRTDITIESLQALAQATLDFRGAAAQLILGFENAKRQIDAMFGDTVRSITIAGLDAQAQYKFLQDEAERMLVQALGSTNADEVTRLAGMINQDINSAFGLLTPGQQSSMGPEFIERINAANADLQAHLTDLQTTTQTTVNDLLAKMEALFLKNADEVGTAATTMNTAGNNMLTASNRTLRVDFHADVPGDAVVNDGG